LAGRVMTVSLKDLETWFQDRPKWLQDAARRLVLNGSLSKQDYGELQEICFHEATGLEATFCGLSPGSLAVTDTTKALCLDTISDVQGINALSPTKPLSFAKSKLCIVYGRNGAGKSGYVRLLKHACGSRRPGDLLGDIFGTAAQPQSACFTFTEDGKTSPATWNGTPIPELQGVEIYDTACGLVYVNEECEVAFEPWLLRLFTQLTEACTTLSASIKKQIGDQISKKPAFPPEYLTTTSATWYADLSVNTAMAQVEEKTAWRTEDETELTNIIHRLAEPH